MEMAVQTMGDMVRGQEPLTVEGHETVFEANRRMGERHKSAVLVLQNGKAVGIFTEMDLLQRVLNSGRDPKEVRVSEVMSSPLVTAPPDLSYHEGLRRMKESHVRYLPIVDGSRLLGIVSRRDLMSRDLEVIEEMLQRVEPAALFI